MEVIRSRLWTILAAVWLAFPAVATAGMPSVTISDLAEMRLHAISFFIAGFLASAWIVKGVWNYLARDFPKLPRLSFGRATSLVFLWGLLFIVVLTMISGARELMTPGAWEKHNWTYKLPAERNAGPAAPNGDPLLVVRESQLKRLFSQLSAYADSHDGRFPASPQDSQISAELWQLPERVGIDYLYRTGLTKSDGQSILAFEPDVYGNAPAVLLVNGRVLQMSPRELWIALGQERRQ